MPKKPARDTAKPVSFSELVKKMFGSGGEGVLGGGKAREAHKKVKGRKKRLDEAMKKQGAK